MKNGADKLYYALWFAGGAVSLVLTLYGCFAYLMFDYRKIEELCLGHCPLLPFACFLIGLRSTRRSAALFWLSFVALWLTRANIRPNPEFNPVAQPKQARRSHTISMYGSATLRQQGSFALCNS
jgi:hypothetical protein